MGKVQYEPTWDRHYPGGGVAYYRGGLFEVGEPREPDIIVDRLAYHLLLDYIRKHEKGVLTTDREEDLKIIHKCLDIIKVK